MGFFLGARPQTPWVRFAEDYSRGFNLFFFQKKKQKALFRFAEDNIKGDCLQIIIILFPFQQKS
jgi:hypothetical protein